MKHATIDEFQGRIVHHHVRCFEKNKQEISVLNKHHVDLTDPLLVSIVSATRCRQSTNSTT